MAQSYFPFDSGQGANVTENSWSKMARLWANTGVVADAGGILSQLSVYADSTGMQVKVESGAAWIKGHYFENSDALTTLGIATANATNPRIDRVVVRLDWTLNTITLAVLQGTPAVTPTLPALTQNTSRWEISLAQVRVNAAVSTIAAGNITDERNFPGKIIWSGNSVPIASTVITPVVKLDDCQNGWLLCWANGAGGNQTYTTVSKHAERGTFHFQSMPAGGSWPTAAMVTKVLSLSADGTQLTGHDDNNSSTNNNRFLIWIKAV